MLIIINGNPWYPISNGERNSTWVPKLETKSAGKTTDIKFSNTIAIVPKNTMYEIMVEWLGSIKFSSDIKLGKNTTLFVYKNNKKECERCYYKAASSAHPLTNTPFLWRGTGWPAV